MDDWHIVFATYKAASWDREYFMPACPVPSGATAVEVIETLKHLYPSVHLSTQPITNLTRAQNRAMHIQMEDALAGEYGEEHQDLVRDAHRVAVSLNSLGSQEQSSRDQHRPGSATHSPDYREVNWYGVEYRFTPNQARCVARLWRAADTGTPDVHDAAMLDAEGIQSERLRDVFKGHEAWGTMIRRGITKGTHRLAPPPVETILPPVQN